MAEYPGSAMSANDPLALLFLRKQRLDEMKRGQDLAREFPGQSYAGSTPSEVSSLEDDINSDPYTGNDAMQRGQDYENQLHDESAYMRPEATAVRKSKLNDVLSEKTAAVNAQNAGMLAVEREKNQGALQRQTSQDAFTREILGNKGATNDVGGQGFTPSVGPDGRVSLKGVPAHKPTTEEQRALDTMGSLSALGPEMLARYEAQYPGIEKDPSKFGGLYNMLTGGLSGAAYKTGFVADNESDQMNQLTGYLEAVLPRMLSSGRINREQYTDLKMHVPQLGLSAGANYGRAKYVLDAILPHVRAAIGSQPGAAVADPYSDPNWGR